MLRRNLFFISFNSVGIEMNISVGLQNKLGVKLCKLNFLIPTQSVIN